VEWVSRDEATENPRHLGGLGHRPHIAGPLMCGDHRRVRPGVVLVNMGADQVDPVRVEVDLLDGLPNSGLLGCLAAL
jgi:hypothetical protein